MTPNEIETYLEQLLRSPRLVHDALRYAAVCAAKGEIVCISLTADILTGVMQHGTSER